MLQDSDTQKGLENLKSSLRHQLHILYAGCLTLQLPTLLISDPAPRTVPDTFSKSLMALMNSIKQTSFLFLFWGIDVTLMLTMKLYSGFKGQKSHGLDRAPRTRIVLGHC